MSLSRLSTPPRSLTAKFHIDIAPIDGPIFHHWSADAFGHQWQRACKAARVQNFHFHDLRHTFATKLQNLGVSWEIRSALLGHSTKAVMTSQYSHGGHGWNLKLREAVSLLETTYTLSYNVSYDILPSNQPTEKKVVNLSSDKGKGWWSQRDLNPCLSLERDGWRKLRRLVIEA